jgi:hypothetical protein
VTDNKTLATETFFTTSGTEEEDITKTEITNVKIQNVQNPLKNSPILLSPQPKKISDTSISSKSSKKGSYVEKLRHFHQQAEKLTPCILPDHWNFVNDVSLREAPLVACDKSMLLFLCAAFLPDASSMMAMTAAACLSAEDAKKASLAATESRVYLAERVFDVATIDRLGDGEKLRKRQGLTLIPLYSIFRALCVEWKKLSAEDKLTLNEHSGQVYESLRTLNGFYDKNCERLKLADEHVREGEAQVITLNAVALKFEKELKRLEKKWNGNVATAAEIDRMIVVKEELAKAQVRRYANNK